MMRQQSQQEETEQTLPRALTPAVEEASVVGEIESTEVDLTARKIEKLKAVNRKRKRVMRWIGLPITGVVITFTLLRSIIFTQVNPNSLYAHALLGLLVANYLWFAAMLPGMLEAHNRAVRSLANTDDLRAVGALAEALSGGDTANSIAGSVLIRLLPRMRAEDMALLTPTQRKCLRNALQHAANPHRFARYNPTLALAILNALARIGDVEDLPVLESVARRQATTPEQQSLQSAAANCLSRLQARFAGVERSNGVLLEDYQALPPAATQLTPEAVEALSSRLRQIARLRKRNLKVTAAGALAGTVLAFVSLANGGNPTSPPMLAALLSSLGIMGLFAARDLYAQRNLTQALIHTDDLRIVGPLVEAAASSEVSAEIATMALTPLLSRLQASDAGMLDANGHESLHRALMRHRRNTDFVLAALRALQQIGDARALPVVQKLADRASRSAAGQSVCEAALACLPFLQLRAAQDEANQTLLRASAANAAPSDTLLRPVQQTPQTVSEELLRPGTPPAVSEREEDADVFFGSLWALLPAFTGSASAPCVFG